jgi:murein DD-endopeptidase MepM/ murein hydrolase activator NlpD
MRQFAHSFKVVWRFLYVACIGLSLILATACANVTTAPVAEQSLSDTQTITQDNAKAESSSSTVIVASNDKNDGPRPVLRSGFGPRKVSKKKSRMHYGIDISAPTGSHVLAFADGEVTRAGTARGYGKCIDITHANGDVTRYAHMSKLFSKVGDTVQKGHLIGLVGRTGRSTGPHLHFEIRHKGMLLDPAKYLEIPNECWAV